MPLYEYVCQDCGEVVPLFSSVDNRDEMRMHEHHSSIPEVRPLPGVLKRRVGYVPTLILPIAAFGAFESEMGPDPT